MSGRDSGAVCALRTVQHVCAQGDVTRVCRGDGEGQSVPGVLSGFGGEL